MSSAVAVGRAELRDLDELAPLFDEYRQFQGQPGDLPAARRFMQARFDGGDSVVFMARVRDAATGFAQLYPSYSSVAMARVFVLNDLFVAAACRRQGVAARLLAAAESHAWSCGAVRVTLNVAKGNREGQALYESRGWLRDQQFHMFHRYPEEEMPRPVQMTNSDVVLRAASRADAQCLSALATQVFFETYATSGIRSALAREAKAELGVDVFTGKLGEASHRTTVAERDGHLLGFAEIALGAAHALVAAPSSAELTRLYVQSPFLRRGLGQRLLRHAEDVARAEGASVLWLTAWVGNTRALAFYASQGYEELGSTDYRFQGESFENRLFARRLEPRPS